MLKRIFALGDSHFDIFEVILACDIQDNVFRTTYKKQNFNIGKYQNKNANKLDSMRDTFKGEAWYRKQQ
jgi:hypothetical protein